MMIKFEKFEFAAASGLMINGRSGLRVDAKRSLWVWLTLRLLAFFCPLDVFLLWSMTFADDGSRFGFFCY